MLTSLPISVRVSIFLIFVTLIATAASDVCGASQEWYLESAAVFIECDKARVYVSCFVTCNGSTYVHFPAEVNLKNSDLENCAMINLDFNKTSSTLMYCFEDTAPSVAEEKADSLTHSINSAFDKNFKRFSTVENHLINITYTANGTSNMLEYLNNLKSKCLKPDLSGFSENVLPGVIEHSENASMGIMAKNHGETWACSFYTSSESSIPTGTDEHFIDVLNYFNAVSLYPSNYAEFGGNYLSSVHVSVISDESVSLLSYKPVIEANEPFVDRGWYTPVSSNHQISATFYFGSDSTPVQTLTFTFEGSIVPEFDSSLLIFTFAAIGLTLVILVRKTKILANSK